MSQAVEARLDGHEETLNGAGEELDGLLAEIGENFESSIQEVSSSVLTDGVNGLVDKMEETITETLKSNIDELVERLMDEFKEMAKKVTESDEETKELREALLSADP